MSESIILRTTLSQLVAAYRQSDLEICHAFASVLAAQERLETAFGGNYSFDIVRQMERHHLDFDQPAKVMAEIKKDAWRALIDRMELWRAVDNVFHALDAQGSVKSTPGPLIDAILASQDGRGETAYFKFKRFGNGNLHLEFKRRDLVTKLNQVAAGQRLRPPSDNPPPPTGDQGDAPMTRIEIASEPPATEPEVVPVVLKTPPATLALL